MREELGPDVALARIAARRHGLVTYAELLGAGVDKSGIARRLAAGRLHRVFRGVYAVGHPGLSNEGRWLAAVLACGGGAALSHRSAAELWGMLPVTQGTIHVAVPARSGRSRRGGVYIHRPLSLPLSALTRRNGIPVTTPARTIEDLRRTTSARDLRRAIREAEFAGLPLGEQAEGSDHTRSELERRFVHLCARARLPKPEVNVEIAHTTVDFLWPESRLVVETDGYAAHRGRQAFVDDRARDNRLMALGYDVLRFTYRRVMDEPKAVAALVRARLRS